MSRRDLGHRGTRRGDRRVGRLAPSATTADRRLVMPPRAASPAGASARPRSTTSPARPGSAGPPSTGCSPAARTACVEALRPARGRPAVPASASAELEAARHARGPPRHRHRRRPAGSSPTTRCSSSSSPTSPSSCCPTSPSTGSTACSTVAAALCRPHLAASSRRPRRGAARRVLARAVAHLRLPARRRRRPRDDPDSVRRLVAHVPVRASPCDHPDAPSPPRRTP